MKLDPILYASAATLLFLGLGLLFSKLEKKYIFTVSIIFFLGSSFLIRGYNLKDIPEAPIFTGRGGSMVPIQAIVFGSLMVFFPVLALVLPAHSRKEENRFHAHTPMKAPQRHEPIKEEINFDDLHEDFEQKMKKRKKSNKAVVWNAE